MKNPVMLRAPPLTRGPPYVLQIHLDMCMILRENFNTILSHPPRSYNVFMASYTVLDLSDTGRLVIHCESQKLL